MNLHLSRALYMSKDRRGVISLCLRVSLGENVSRHEMTLCDFWLRGCLSSLQRHDLPKIYYANLTLTLCFLLPINKKIKLHVEEFLDPAYKNSTAPNLGGALFVLVSI